MKTLFGLCCAILAVVTAPTSSFAQLDTTLSNFKLQGGFFGSLNLYSGTFRTLPNIQRCCVDFDGGIGVGGAAVFGVEMLTDVRLDNRPLSLGVNASYSLLNGAYSKDEFIGNVISGSEVIRGTSNHRLNVDYGLVSIEPYAAIPVPMINKLVLTVGVQVGLPILSTVSFREQLLAPIDDNVVFETGSRIRNEQSGDITDASSIALSALVGLRYEISVSPFLTISPAITYFPSFSKLSSTTDWSVSSVRFGALFQYQLRTIIGEELPKPPPAPEPIPELVKEPVIVQKPIPPTIQVAIQTKSNGAVDQNDTLFVPAIQERVVIAERSSAPIIFFEKNSTTPVKGTTAATSQEEIVAAINTLLHSNPRGRLTVIGSASSDEEPQILRQRVSWLVTQLSIPAEQITIQTVTAPVQERTELNEDQRYVRVQLNNANPVLTSSVQTTTRTIDDVQLQVATLISCFAAPCVTTVKASINNKEVQTQGADIVRVLTIPKQQLETPAQIMLLATITDSAQQQGSVTEERIVVAQVIASDSTLMFVTDAEGIALEAEVLGYFNFAEKEFSSVNQPIVQKVQAAIAQGKSITLLPGTDSFGDVPTNDVLQKERAATARRIIGATEQQTTVLLNVANSSPNTTPMGRHANRCVRVLVGK